MRSPHLRNPLEIPCPWCKAPAGEPCWSVSQRPVVEPHMARLSVCLTSEELREERDAYARAVVTHLFGHCSEQLLERARKDRSIDFRKRWVRRELGIPDYQPDAEAPTDAR